jgi:hypothetical protein
MTSRGDIIVRNASNVTARLAKGSAGTYLGSDGTDVAYAAVTDAQLSTSDITTNNASTTKHGFTPKYPNDATKYLDGTGAYTTPSGSASVGSTAQGISLTSGSLTLTGSTTTHTEVASSLRLTLAGAINDVILAGFTGLFVAGAGGEATIDIATIVSSAIVNRFVSGGSRLGMAYNAAVTGPCVGTSTYKLVSGDISGGNVVVSPSFYNGSASAGTLYATTTYAFRFWAVNLGH